MTYLSKILELNKILLKYIDNNSCEFSNGSIFISKIGKQELRYLHKLFRASNKSVDKIKDILWSNLPKSYEQFISLWDGATLFDNSLFVFGSCDQISRELDPEKQTAISLMEEAHQRGIEFGDNNANFEWVPIGTAAAARLNFEILISRGGASRLAHSEGFIEFPSFLDLMLRVCGLLDRISDAAGLYDDEGVEMEKELLLLGVEN